MHIPSEITGSPVAPYWLAKSDITDDALQDIWQEATDPHNERGEVITAHYARTMQARDIVGSLWTEMEPWLDLIGATVEGRDGIRHLSRFELDSRNIFTPQFDRWEEE